MIKHLELTRSQTECINLVKITEKPGQQKSDLKGHLVDRGHQHIMSGELN